MIGMCLEFRPEYIPLYYPLRVINYQIKVIIRSIKNDRNTFFLFTKY